MSIEQKGERGKLIDPRFEVGLGAWSTYKIEKHRLTGEGSEREVKTEKVAVKVW